MMRFSSRSGSAILIVLGMLSFMVVSAVGFAVFMRQSRVPSSYLRRASSSRYLLKAALANAIARIDGCYSDVRGGRCEGILDDPYPGVGQNINRNDPTQRDNGNYWPHRVFTPFGPVSTEETVSTLTLEGLAYLPPAIINEARVFSRTTRTAQWRNLSYDSGRYAFTAYDVSDCFDINKLFAGERRFSAANQRVNLSSLFPDNGDQLDNILEKCSRAVSKSNIPFVSVADFNIVAGSSPFSPFCRHIASGNNVSMYSQGDFQSVSNALFITDTWFPPTNTTTESIKRIDLSKYQPFVEYRVRNMDDVDAALNSRKPSGCPKSTYEVLRDNIGGTGLVCLYDYMDRDRVPTSLALPTVETEPMICGVSVGIDGGGNFTAEPAAVMNGEAVLDPATQWKVVREVTPRVLTIQQAQVTVSGAVAFPFKRVSSSSRRKGSWTAEALVAIFFASDNLKARLDGNSPIRPKKDYWASSTTAVRDGVIWTKGQAAISFNDNIQRSQDAVKNFAIPVSVSRVTLPICYKVHEKEVRDTGNGSELVPGTEFTAYTRDQTWDAGDSPLLVFDENGKLSSSCESISRKQGYNPVVAISPNDLQSKHGQQSQNFENTIDAGSFRPYFAVWVRVLDASSGADPDRRTGGTPTVDLVPASCIDDNELNMANTDPGFMSEMQKMGGPGVPLLDFKCKDQQRFSYRWDQNGDGFQPLLNGQPPAFEGWNALFTVDPRYNYAPEDWFGTMDGDATAEKWLGYSRQYLGVNGRDPDIFMFTSDQEYLQSIGELAFIPYIEPMNGNVNFIEGEFMRQDRYHRRNDFNARTPGTDSGFANPTRYWRTYTAIEHNGGGYDPIYSMVDRGVRYEFTSGEGDFRVNPYSPDSRVLMAALKDTPYDYFVASTNEDSSVNPTIDMKASERVKWAFCEGSSTARLADEELLDIAGTLSDAFADSAENGETNWENTFDDMAWYDGNNKEDDQRKILGDVELGEPLHGVDRKFLYSYWRDCFQNRQQLFLVFVRAEPLTVGGTGSHACGSSQLGARGVALVWRDPQPPTRGGASSRPKRTSLTSPSNWDQYYRTFAPHRTRVLFYHQFD
ncbi:MAG: hypothetical protein K6G91_06625 [Kiritimatiellae bacterium]|nr:hypothetical protein [Kiritimatiellia bacterium]